MSEKQKFCVDVFFYAYSYLGSIDMGYQGDVPPEWICDYHTTAKSAAQAENFARYKFLHEGRCNGHPLNHFEFKATEVTE